MPVSTRSQFSVVRDEPNQLATAYRHRAPALPDQEAVAGTAPLLLRNPHHALKEKMKALTLFYEQHQHQLAGAARSAVPRGQRHVIATHHPSVDLLDSSVKKRGGGEEEQAEEETNMAMKENVVNSNELLMTSMGLSKKPAVSHAAAKTKENIGTVGGGDRAFLLPLPGGKEEPGVAGTPISLGGRGTASEPGVSRPKRSSGGSDMGAISGNRCGISGTAGGASRIMVYVRLRPLAKKEKEAGCRCCVRIVDRRDVYLTEFASETDYLRLKRLRGRHFSFDASFSESTVQQEVYATTTAELVEGVLQGKNGSVFCYGATGAGKTYTMLGTVENPGVMVLAIKDLFAKIRQRSFDGSHVVHLSYLEVYNETVRDLLSPGRPLVLREDKQGIVAAGLTQYRAYSTDEVMALLQQGNQNRTTEPTRANETSSRSHAILQVVAEHREKVSGSSGVVHRVGKLSLIDLAGSERALATEQRTQRSLEGANINRSLLALSSCINALVEGKKHIPYRNSKLTQLLKDSLGGSSCNTVMMANISPGNLSFAETQNTLHWADRAKQIRTKAAAVNEESLQVPESDDAKLLLLQLQKENGELRRQLAQQKQKLLTLQAQTLAANNSTPAPSPANDGGDANLKMSPAPSSSQRRPPKRSILAAAACFSTPESKKRVPNDDVARRLQDRVKALELELERVKKEHRLQIKQKDDFIRELVTIRPPEGGGEERIVTRASLRKAESAAAAAAAAAAPGELKGPRHRFLSPPVPTAKKRSFWDITAANSPSVISINGRKTKSHVAADTTPTTNSAAAPSMLLQPGFFTRQKLDTAKNRKR